MALKGCTRNPDKHPVLCWTDLNLMAKVYTAIEGRTVPSKGAGRRGKSQSVRHMGLSDLFIEAVEEKVRDVVPSKNALAKCRELRKRNKKRNEAASWDSLPPDEKERYTNKKMLIYYRNKAAKDKTALMEAKLKGASSNAVNNLKKRLESAEKSLRYYEAVCSGYEDKRKRKR